MHCKMKKITEYNRKLEFKKSKAFGSQCMAKQKRAMFPKKALATVDGSGNQDSSACVR